MIDQETENQFLKTDAVCPDCGISHKPQVPRIFWDGKRDKNWRCESCANRKLVDFEEDDRKWRREQRTQAWKKICPLEYQTEAEGGKTVESRLDSAIITGSDGAEMARQGVLLSEEGQECGVWLAGESGAMKTRIAWRLCRGLFDRGKSIIPFTAWSWQAKYQDAAGKFESEEWMGEVSKCGLLFVDDVGKMEWSANASAAFFEMVERRTSTGKPMLFTSNHGRGDLGVMFGGSKSLAIQGSSTALTRRLKEFCKAYLVENRK